MDKVTLCQFFDMLQHHDWYYDYSDDNRVWSKGQSEARALARIAEQSQEHNALLEAFRDHMFSGSPWNTEKKPKPERPCS